MSRTRRGGAALAPAVLALLCQSTDEPDLGAGVRAICARDAGKLLVYLDGDVGRSLLSDGSGSLLHLAVTLQRVDLVEHLLAKGADRSAVDRLGETPIHKAAQVGSSDLLSAVLEGAEDVAGRPNSFGWTPLHFAIALRHEDAVRALVELTDAGARTATSRLTPWELACLVADARILDAVRAHHERRDLPLEGAGWPRGEVVPRVAHERIPDVLIQRPGGFLKLWSDGNVVRKSEQGTTWRTPSPAAVARVVALCAETGIVELADTEESMFHVPRRTVTLFRKPAVVARTDRLVRDDYYSWPDCARACEILRMSVALDICQAALEGLAAER